MILIPSKSPEDWSAFLARPYLHWKRGYSATSLAYCWEEANGFPECVRKAFRASELPLLRDTSVLLAIPEHKVPLPGGRTASQNDLFVLAKGDAELISITVEGKVSEPFGPLVSE